MTSLEGLSSHYLAIPQRRHNNKVNKHVYKFQTVETSYRTIGLPYLVKLG